jgi:hypothetical protein
MSRLKLVVWSFLLWTGLGLFFASQLVLGGLPWSTALQFSMPRWYSWSGRSVNLIDLE